MTTPTTAVWTSSVVLAALIAIAITPGAPPFSLPAPGAGSCAPGASVVLRGVQRAPYDREHLAAGTGHDATTAQFVLPVTSHIVVHLAGGAGICWSGGEALGAFPPAASWNTIHETYGMVAGVTNRADAPGITVENFTSFAYGKGVSMDAGGDTGWTIRNVHVVYGRDDCIENDWYNTGLIDSSFFDGCYDVMSSLEDRGQIVPDGRNNVVTIRNSLLRLQVMDGIFEVREAAPRHEAFWKWSATRGPKLSLSNNVFFSDDSSVSSNHADMYMAPPPGRLGPCANNVMIWEGNGPFPEPLPSCFTVETGARGLQIWDSVVARWKARHPDSLPDVAPPIVSLFQPGVTGSTLFSGTVALVATAVDDRGVVGVQFRLDGQPIGPEVTAPTLVRKDRFTKYQLVWNSSGAPAGSHALTATARDGAGNALTSAPVTVTVRN